MVQTGINLKDVSVRFRRHSRPTGGLKEFVVQCVQKPKWMGTRHKTESEFWALNGINLELGEGDRLGIIGPNGAGKSTLLKVISRIYTPTQGNVHVQGKVAPLIEIGAGFNPELTGRENSFLNASILGISRRTLSSRLENVVRFSELNDFFDTPVKYYSTGMSLRLAFTLATEISPDILILDELYAGGDAAFIEKANRRLDAFVSKSKILILVAHNLEYIKRFCTKVIVLHQGRILGQGNPEDMIDKYLKFSRGEKSSFETAQNSELGLYEA